jgi:hypothetical protein
MFQPVRATWQQSRCLLCAVKCTALVCIMSRGYVCLGRRGKVNREVVRRPPLYKKNMKEYSDRNLKEKLWNEICESVVTNWSEHFDAKGVNSFFYILTIGEGWSKMNFCPVFMLRMSKFKLYIFLLSTVNNRSESVYCERSKFL